jgi:hypothetical protein
LLIEVVARACKTISVAVGKGALGGVLGDAGSGNIQGEAQKKLDVIANDVLLEANAWGGHLAACASEEMDHCQPIPDAYPRGNYLLLFDPLRRQQQHRRQRIGRHDLLRAALPRGRDAGGRRALPAAGHRAGGRRLLHLRARARCSC